MSRAPVLGSAVDTAGPAFAANEAANRALASELRERIATAALGGPEKTRVRHVERGKLLPATASTYSWTPVPRSWRSPHWPPTGSTARTGRTRRAPG